MELEQIVQERDQQAGDMEYKLDQVSKDCDSSAYSLSLAKEELIDLEAKVRAYEKARAVNQSCQQHLQNQL